MQPLIHPHAHTRAHTCTHSRTHMRAYAHTRMRTHTNTHTHGDYCNSCPSHTPMHVHAQVWSLDEQVGHKVAFMREHVLLPGRPPCVLLGHSIGMYMAAKALDQVRAWGPESGG